MTAPRHMILSSLEATKTEAVSFAKSLRGGELVAFTGQLGSGKTTFIRYLCSALGARVQATSPTYVLQHEYPAAGGLLIEHWDLYRLKELPLELEEAAPLKTIRLIEWAERFPELCERATMELEFFLESETARKLTITSRHTSQ